MMNDEVCLCIVALFITKVLNLKLTTLLAIVTIITIKLIIWYLFLSFKSNNGVS